MKAPITASLSGLWPRLIGVLFKRVPKFGILLGYSYVTGEGGEPGFQAATAASILSAPFINPVRCSMRWRVGDSAGRGGGLVRERARHGVARWDHTACVRGHTTPLRRTSRDAGAPHPTWSDTGLLPPPPRAGAHD